MTIALNVVTAHSPPHRFSSSALRGVGKVTCYSMLEAAPQQLKRQVDEEFDAK
jgi:hypothetical protein